MDQIKIKQIYGADIKQAVDEFYNINGGKGCARDEDLFFIAYLSDKIVGCIRFCVEENTPMLRTMRVDSSLKKQGIGRKLLNEVAKYLDQNNIKNVFCLPYTHLTKFYGIINFEVVPDTEVPQFLIDRSAEYVKNGTITLFMRRC